MAIAAANLFTRNIYREYLRPDCTERQESRMARTVSLLVKLGALAFILFFPTTLAINLQLLSNIWIIQTLPAVFLGLYTSWFHRYALLIGLLVGLVSGTTLVVEQHFLSSITTLSLGGFHLQIYIAVIALTINVALCTILTPLFRLFQVSDGVDGTTPLDFETCPVVSAPIELLVQQLEQPVASPEETVSVLEAQRPS
jgi:SSS family solute:Na+ symporter